MATTVTLNTLMERLVSSLWGNQYVIPSASLNASSSATSLIIDGGPAGGLRDFTYSSNPTSAYDGVGFYLTVHDAAAIAPEGEYSKVTRSGFSGTTATFTLSPALSAAPNLAEAASRLLMFFGLTPYDFLEAINNIVRTLYLPRFLPLCGRVGDGDMESSGVTAWAAVGAPGTRVKDANYALVGKYALSLATTSLNEGATSGESTCTEAQQVIVSAAVRVLSGSVKVQFYDTTNAAEIHSVTVDQSHYTEVRFNATVPDNCEGMQIRFLSATATSSWVVGWAALITQDEIYDLTSSDISTLDSSDIEGIYSQRTGMTSEASESYVAFTEKLERWADYEPLKDYYAGISHWPQMRAPTDRLMFIKFRGTGTAFTGINATTSEVCYAPIELIVEGALAELKEMLRNRTQSRSKKDIYNSEMREHRRTYRGMLDSLDLGKPTVSYTPARRVCVP